jgi:signal peptidase I
MARQTKHENPKKDKKENIIVEMLETFLMSFIVLMVIYWTVALPEVVKGASMEPTFQTDERILVDRVSKHFKELERGDVVVLHPPGKDNVDYIKRIVGVPGDIIKILDCNIYISKDGEKFLLEEPYLHSGTCTTEGPSLKEGRSIRIEDGQYVVLGDNRAFSVDSRIFGIIDEERILGRVVFRFWPFDRAEVF